VALLLAGHLRENGYTWSWHGAIASYLKLTFFLVPIREPKVDRVVEVVHCLAMQLQPASRGVEPMIGNRVRRGCLSTLNRITLQM
jgi:hypothetical protein